MQVLTLRFEKTVGINGNLNIHCTFPIKCGIKDGQKAKVGMRMETNGTETELDLYSWCIQSVLKLIAEANTYKRQNLIEATLSTMNYTKW